MTETTTPGAAVDLAELAWPPALTPYLGVADARSALDWYVEVFHAERRGEPIHAGRQHRARRAGHRGRGADDRRGLSGGRRDRAAPGEGTSVSIFVQVPDADAAVQRAVDRGAELIRPVADQPYGRSGVIRDPRGVAEDIHTACKQSELPTSIEGRPTAHARRDRGVRLFDQPDGMATLAGYLDAGDAVGIYGLLDAYARQAARDDRTMDARRADALVDLVFGSAGRASANAGDHCTGSEGSPTDTGQAGPRQSDTTERATPDSARGDDLSGVRRSGRPASRVHAQVRLTVPASMVLGLDDEPAYLAGYGYIPADAARELAADGVWRRIVTDPLTGALLDYGTTRYAPPPSLAEYVIARDQRCVFPGCRVPAHRCDLDHREPHDPRGDTGRTSADNLDAQCRAHPF